jgi:hypothetical protein
VRSFGTMSPQLPLHNYGSSDSEDTVRNNNTWSRQPFIHSSNVPTAPRSHFLAVISRRSSISSAATSRSTSPLPQLYPASHQSSSCPSESDSDSEPRSPLLLDFVDRDTSWRENRRHWWSSPTRRRRKKSWQITRFSKRWLRWLVHLPFFPSQPTTIVCHFVGQDLLSHLLTLE